MVLGSVREQRTQYGVQSKTERSSLARWKRKEDGGGGGRRWEDGRSRNSTWTQLTCRDHESRIHVKASYRQNRPARVYMHRAYHRARVYAPALPARMFIIQRMQKRKGAPVIYVCVLRVFAKRRTCETAIVTVSRRSCTTMSPWGRAGNVDLSSPTTPVLSK